MHGYKYCMQHHVVNIMYELFPFLQQFSSLFIHIKYYISKDSNFFFIIQPFFLFFERERPLELVYLNHYLSMSVDKHLALLKQMCPKHQNSKHNMFICGCRQKVLLGTLFLTSFNFPMRQ